MEADTCFLLRHLSEYLEGILKEEQTSDEFSDLPRDYLEVSKVLFEIASDDLNNPDKLRLLLKDIREARQSKIREGLGALNSVHLGVSTTLSTLTLSSTLVYCFPNCID